LAPRKGAPDDSRLKREKKHRGKEMGGRKRGVTWTYSAFEKPDKKQIAVGEGEKKGKEGKRGGK